MHKAVSTEYAHKILKKLIPEGGEGIVARIPNSLYVRGRTNSVMKFKVPHPLRLRSIHLTIYYLLNRLIRYPGTQRSRSACSGA